MSTKTAYDPADQAAWEAKIDALSPDEVFVAVALDPSPLHQHLSSTSFVDGEGARERKRIEHAVFSTLPRIGDVEIEFLVRRPAYSGDPENAIYEVTGRVIEKDAAILGLGGDLCLVVKPEQGRTIVLPVRYIDGMRLAR